MGEMVNTLCRFVVSALRSKRDLVLENAALRHQLMVLQRQSKAPRIENRDRLFWITLLRLWPDWRGALSLVQPATVVRWHRKGFRAYWRWKSRTNGGRPRIDPPDRHRRDRLLRGSHGHVPRAPRLPRHVARPAPHPALQRHDLAFGPMDRPAGRRGFSLRVIASLPTARP